MKRLLLPPPPPDKEFWPWTEPFPAQSNTVPQRDQFPKITVVTPSFNQGAYIEETIRSVILQGYPNLEYFIMDGGSEDNTVEIILKYEPWLAGWVSESDLGQAHAVNKGWTRSSGKILGWLNSDDIYTPDTLARVAQAWIKSGKPGVIYGDAAGVDKELRFINHKKMDAYNLVKMLTGVRVAQPAAFISKELYRRLGPLDENLHYSLDYEYFFRAWLLPESSNFTYIPEILAYSRHQYDRKSDTAGAKFVDENINVLKGVWQEKMKEYQTSSPWRLAFARGIIKEADKYLLDGFFRSAFDTYLEAGKQSIWVLPHLLNRLLRTATKRILRKSKHLQKKEQPNG